MWNKNKSMLLLLALFIGTGGVLFMANKYCNLQGGDKIKDTYTDINTGFDRVDADVSALGAGVSALDGRVDTIITTPAEGVTAQEIIDARKGQPTLGARLDEVDASLAENTKQINSINSQITSIYNASEADIYNANMKFDFLNIVNRCKFALTAKGISPFAHYKITSGKVEEWYDQKSNSFTPTKAYQLTADSRPTHVENIPLCTDIVKLPDIAGGTVGKGFTCTGVTYDKTEGIFYVGNIGKELPSTPGFASTIVKLSKDGTTNLGEISIGTTFPTMLDIQGLTIDTSDDTIWFCSFGENKIRHIYKTGESIGYIDINSPSGLAYDSSTDTLWVLTSTALKNINKTGSEITSIAVSITGQDQLYLDEANGIMYFTAGTNYTGTNYVYKVDLETETIELAYSLKESYAVEGIYIENNTMYIFNDGYYHSGTVAVNQMNIYDISKIMNAPQFDVVDDALIVDSSVDIDFLEKMTIVIVAQNHGSGGSDSGRLFDKSSGSNTGFLLNNQGGTDLQFVQYKDTGLLAWTATGCVTKGKTFHAALTFDRSNTANEPVIYVNGVAKTLTRTLQGTGGFTDDTGVDLYIGNRADLSRAINGFIFDFYVINEILPPIVIAELYNTAKQYYDLE